MKKAICFLTAIFTCMQLFPQENKGNFVRMELGPCLHFNSLNEDYYFRYMNEGYLVENTSMMGLNLKFSLAFRQGLDFIFGTLAEIGMDNYTDGEWNPGYTNSSDYVLNGGGVYFGLNPHTKGEHFGLDADIAAGILAYKEYRVIYNDTVEPYVDKYDKKSSIFGGIASVGFYLRGKTLGVSPQFQVIMAGGNNGSFLFYGFYVPLTISF